MWLILAFFASLLANLAIGRNLAQLSYLKLTKTWRYAILSFNLAISLEINSSREPLFDLKEVT